MDNVLLLDPCESDKQGTLQQVHISGHDSMQHTVRSKFQHGLTRDPAKKSAKLRLTWYVVVDKQ